jgi:hypothetical protein
MILGKLSITTTYIYIGINIKIETLVVDCDSENKIKKGVAKRK